MLALLLLALGLERMKQKIAMQAPTGLLFLVMVLMTTILLIWRKKFIFAKVPAKNVFLELLQHSAKVP